nr:carbohydrate-binding, CenC-like protein [Tanacetum cinerariifolium]
MLKGGLTVNESGSALLYFQSKNASIDIWVDSVSLQPFTQEEWKSHRYQSIDKFRKSNVKLQAVNSEGKPLANRTLTIAQKFANFPFGCAINKNILANSDYQNWFLSRFKYTTFENEMKWYTNERVQNQEDYSAADALLEITKSNEVQVRGHNVFWDDPKYQPSWVPNLETQQLSDATIKRINSVMGRYSGQVISWDVVNENLHYNFFESKLGDTASLSFYTTAWALDSNAALFLNDFDTIESPGDRASSPDNYLLKIKQISDGGYDGPLSIGLEGHFRYLNIPYMRSAIDKVATSGLSIWLTEVDTQPGPDQAAELDQVLREAHAHPFVNGIVLWSAWSPKGCFRMCLTDNSFRNLPTGDVVDQFIGEFSGAFVTATTDVNGFYETKLIHGDYEVTFRDGVGGRGVKEKNVGMLPLVEEHGLGGPILERVMVSGNSSGTQDGNVDCSTNTLVSAEKISGSTKDSSDAMNIQTDENISGPTVNVAANVTVSPIGLILFNPTSYAKLATRITSKKSVNFRTLITPVENEDEVDVPLESIRAISERFVNTAYGLLLGKWVAYLVVSNYLNPDVNLIKEDLGNVPVWVKLRDVPGRSSYARALIKIQANVKLKDTIVVAMPKLVREGFYTCTIHAEPIIDGKVTLVNVERKLLEKVDSSSDHDNEDEVELVDNEMASFLASNKKILKVDMLFFSEKTILFGAIRGNGCTRSAYDTDRSKTRVTSFSVTGLVPARVGQEYQ